MDVKLLGIYLNDHLAGPRVGWTWRAGPSARTAATRWATSSPR